MVFNLYGQMLSFAFSVSFARRTQWTMARRGQSMTPFKKSSGARLDSLEPLDPTVRVITGLIRGERR